MDESQVFQEEALEILEKIEADVLALREDMNNMDLVGKLFRDLHTIKGSGAMFGFDHIATFTHTVEDTVDSVRRGEVKVTEPLLDLLLSCRDHIYGLLINPDSEDLTPEQEKSILASLNSYLPAADDSPDSSLCLNCWEYMKCGKEKECPAGIHDAFEGMNSGNRGGRICWVITGTMCGNSTQGNCHQKFNELCKDCEFRLLVKRQEGKNLASTVSIYHTLRKLSNHP
jgi:chemotaxis protein histidine kinase CheA